MFITITDIEKRMKREDFKSEFVLACNISSKFGCGFSQETTERIWKDYKAGKINLTS